jgi:V8-like Glu-specific endopeptidase
MVVRWRRLSVLWAAAIVLVTVLVCSGIARAVTYGELDGNDHPYVGLVAFYDNNGEYVWRCSGTLLSPTVVLTAGHCTDGAASAQVWFDSVVTRPPFPDSGGVTGTPQTPEDFEFGNLQHDDKDVGVVVLDGPVEMATYGELPELGLLDKLATQRGTQEQTFTVVGYGLQEVRPNPQADLVRYKGTVSLIDLRSAINDGHTIQVTNNPGKRSTGGICYGDSGGPLLNEDTNVVVGITSFGLNDNCKGTDFFYRTDIAYTKDFVNQFLVP